MNNFRIKEKDNKYYIQKKTALGWSFFITKKVKNYKYGNEIYLKYSSLFPLLFNVVSFLSTKLLIFIVLILINIVVTFILFLFYDKVYFDDIISSEKFLKELNNYVEEEKESSKIKIYYLSKEAERHYKLKKLKNKF